MNSIVEIQKRMITTNLFSQCVC